MISMTSFREFHRENETFPVIYFIDCVGRVVFRLKTLVISFKKSIETTSSFPCIIIISVGFGKLNIKKQTNKRQIHSLGFPQCASRYGPFSAISSRKIPRRASVQIGILKLVEDSGLL